MNIDKAINFSGFPDLLLTKTKIWKTKNNIGTMTITSEVVYVSFRLYNKHL